MNPICKSALALAAMAFTTLTAAQVTFYERESFQGRSFSANGQIDSLSGYGFNDRASSLVVERDTWEFCEDNGFSGRCVVLRPGQYPTLGSMGLDNRVSSVRMASPDSARFDNRYSPSPQAAQITFFEGEDYRGRNHTTQTQIEDFRRSGINQLGTSVDVVGERWEVCEGAGFTGRCVILLPGRYPSLSSMTLSNRISSVRASNPDMRGDDRRYAPAGAVGDYRDGRDFRRRNDERLYQADVTSARAVMGAAEQRCWVERGQVPQQRSGPNVPAAIVGAVLGGIIGHQFGSGTGQDIATVGGAAAGGYVGSTIGRNSPQAQSQDVQRCENVSSNATPSYWDVTYNFRGQEHRVQMTSQPGSTVTVNEQGEPRT